MRDEIKFFKGDGKMFKAQLIRLIKQMAIAVAITVMEISLTILKSF